ncbi:MAG: PqqD family protein [Bacteroidales bacterium]|nr:PqqD family protein [Bacteroidales bacterium]
MKINPKYKLRTLAGESVLFLQGNVDGTTSKLMTLNETSAWLWNNLQAKEFETEDVVKLLLSEFEIDEATAKNDAEEWINTLKGYNIFE